MADPVIFDCGGSTRVKWIEDKNKGAMDGLLDMNTIDPTTANWNPTPPLHTWPLPPGVGTVRGSQWNVQPQGSVRFANMNILFQDVTGQSFTIPVPLPGNFVIRSFLRQTVGGVFNPNGMSVALTIFSTASGVDPLVEAKQHIDVSGQPRRLYVVENAGAISQVFINTSQATPSGQLYFDASNPASSPGASGAAKGAQGPCLYVSVVLS